MWLRVRPGTATQGDRAPWRSRGTGAAFPESGRSFQMAARCAAGRMGPPCGIWATAAGGTSSCRLGETERPQGPLTCLGRGCADPDDQGGAGGSPPRPRPGPLRPAAPQRQGTLPALPPAARPAGASAADPAHPAPTPGPGRPVLRPLPVSVRSWRPSLPTGHDPNRTHGQPARIGYRTADPSHFAQVAAFLPPPTRHDGPAASLVAGGSGATGAAGFQPRPICLASAERVAA